MSDISKANIATIHQHHHFSNTNHHVHFLTVEDVTKLKKPPIFGSAFGIVCSMISVLCFSFNSVIVKLLNSSYQIPGIQVLVSRYDKIFDLFLDNLKFYNNILYTDRLYRLFCVPLLCYIDVHH